MGYGFDYQEPLEPVEEPVQEVEKPAERYGTGGHFGTRSFGGGIISFLLLILLFSGGGFGGYKK